MTQSAYDFTQVDAASMPVDPVASDAFDYARYEAFAQEADQRYARFMAQDEGIMVWQRVRAADVFRGGCADMDASLLLQLGCLTRCMDYLTDAPGYLEPWYGIGTIGSAFGAEYFWSDDQAPAVLERHQLFGTDSCCKPTTAWKPCPIRWSRARSRTCRSCGTRWR